MVYSLGRESAAKQNSRSLVDGRECSEGDLDASNQEEDDERGQQGSATSGLR